MPVTNRHLLDDLPADELDSIVLAQDAAFDHLLVVIDAEAMADQGQGHEIAAHLVD
jgi:hypothetical protein